MNFRDIIGTERVSYRNSLSLETVFEENSHKLYKDSEYVAIWYKKIVNKGNTGKKLVEVMFVNISTKKPSNFQTSIHVSINYLHKIKIGSIWINGLSKECFKHDMFDISMTKDNYNIESFSKAKHSNNEYPFSETEYPLYNLEYDRNNLIQIFYNNKKYILHPLIFFIVHYGYSMEVKRVLLSYLWKTQNDKQESVLNLFHITNLNNNSFDNPIILPNKLTVRDAIFLYHLKNDSYTQTKVKYIVNSARHALANKESSYDFYPVVQPWHEQSIDLRITGIKLNESTILCTSITDISEPLGPDITLIMPPVYKKKNEESKVNKDADEIAIKLRRKKELEKVRVDDAKQVNNLHVAYIKEKMGILGNSRTINKSYEIIENGVRKKYKLINCDEPSEYSVGAGHEGNGTTGLADCFYDTNNTTQNDFSSNDSRLEKLWSHAQNLKKSKNAIVHWFTFNNGFKDDLNFKTMSMSSCHVNDTTTYPNEVFIIRAVIADDIYMVIDFAPETIADKERSIQGIVIKLQEDMNSFLNVDNDTSLSSILIHIAIMNGKISFDYIDSFEGKMVGFRHCDGENNNWILNAIKRIT